MRCAEARPGRERTEGQGAEREMECGAGGKGLAAPADRRPCRVGEHGSKLRPDRARAIRGRPREAARNYGSAPPDGRAPGVVARTKGPAGAGPPVRSAWVAAQAAGVAVVARGAPATVTRRRP